MEEELECTNLTHWVLMHYAQEITVEVHNQISEKKDAFVANKRGYSGYY
jgi:hypothetical protein